MKLNLMRFFSRLAVSFLWISISVLICITPGCIGARNEAKRLVDDVHDKQRQSDTTPILLSSTTKLNGNDKSEVFPFECQADDKDCEKDILGFDAIRSLHFLIDDDRNGNVDLSESDEFLRDELQYTDGFERQELFHNNDKHISVDDLWKTWKHSAVYNWTVDDMIEWLVQDVGLPQYSQMFYNFAIDGSALPRLVNSTSPLLASLGIRNPVHKQKLSLKAMDTILFGAPKRLHSYAKDVILFMSVLLAIGISWFACLHHRYSQTQVKKMMKDLEALQKAEDALKKLSKELADAEKPQTAIPTEKKDELRMLRQHPLHLQVPRLNVGDKSPTRLNKDNSGSHRQEGEIKLKQAEEELNNLRKALSDAENKLEMQQQLESQWSIPEELQAWMQLTYELEQVHFSAKRQAAERQLIAARDGCEKIKKRKQAFFGSLRMAHSNSLDDIDQSILDARAALEEVKQDLQERLHRWHTIEVLCGFPIIGNPGLVSLKQVLGRDPGGATRLTNSMIAPVNFEETEEDLQSTDENRESESIYNQIPERPRQQIFAWAHRSRLNHWMKKKTGNNGHNTTTLPATSKSLSFNKLQTTTGSSLSHPIKVIPPGNSGGSNAKNVENQDGDLQGSSVGNLPATVTSGPSQSSVVFQVGENGHHERSYSSVSLGPVNSNLTNVNNNAQVKTGPNQLSHSTTTASTASLGLRISNSSGNLLPSKTLTKTGSMKLSASASGIRFLRRASLVQYNTTSTIPVQKISEAVKEKHELNNTLDHTNISTLSSDSNSNISSTVTPTSSSNPASGIITSQLQGKNLEVSDAGSLGSVPGTQFDRSPESDPGDLEMDSLNDSQQEGNERSAGRRKKTLLPKFLQKNKGKQKTL